MAVTLLVQITAAQLVLPNVKEAVQEPVPQLVLVVVVLLAEGPVEQTVQAAALEQTVL